MIEADYPEEFPNSLLPALVLHMHKVVALVVALLSVLVTIAYGYTIGGWFTEKRSLNAHIELVSPYFELHLPDDYEGPFPVAIFAPGCLGLQRHHQDWRDALLEVGWAVLIVDSFTPRGIKTIAGLEAVCEGARPWGFERAADLVASSSYLTQVPMIDSSRIALIGWSNGAWAVMDALSFGEDSRPTNLLAIPSGWSEGIVGTVLFYPYCGFGSRSKSYGWTVSPPTLMFLASADQNLPPEKCNAVARRLNSSGATIEVIVFDGATHWFDNPEAYELLPHDFDEAATNESRNMVKELLLGRNITNL